MADLVQCARRAALTYRIAQGGEQQHSGIMVALVPRAEDARRLALAGGEAVGDLHVTLFHYGDASAMPLDARRGLMHNVGAETARFAPLLGAAFGVGVFHPTGAEPALILNVGGEAIDAFRRELDWRLWTSPDQHRPWAAHLTLAYGSAGVPPAIPDFAQLAARMGPVVFDRVRVAFAGEAVDLPFTEPPGLAAAHAARAIYEAKRAGATITACRGAAPARPAFSVHAAAPAAVEVDGDQLSFPVVAAVQGVRQPANSAGPELVLAAQLGRNIDGARAMPVVFQHPQVGGEYVSTDHLGPFDAQTGVRIGIVRDARMDGERMLVDVVTWLSKLRQAGPEAERLGDAILAGETVEVSLGYFTQVVPVGGIYRGDPYVGVHTDIRYDHLALLPLGQRGACSAEAGCGAPRA